MTARPIRWLSTWLAAAALLLPMLATATPTVAAAPRLEFEFPDRAQTGDAVTARLVNPSGPGIEFTMDWGDDAEPGLFGDLPRCWATSEGGEWKPGDKLKVSGGCSVGHTYRTPGTFTAVATAENGQVFRATIVVTGPALYSASATWQFTGLDTPVTSPRQFTVSAQGPSAVCWMRSAGVTSDGPGPHTFVLDPLDFRPNSSSGVVEVRFCDGGETWERIPATVPFLSSYFAEVVNVDPLERGSPARCAKGWPGGGGCWRSTSSAISGLPRRRLRATS